MHYEVEEIEGREWVKSRVTCIGRGVVRNWFKTNAAARKAARLMYGSDEFPSGDCRIVRVAPDGSREVVEG